MNKHRFRDPVFLLRLGGTLVLGVVYLVWRLEEAGLSPAGQLASLLSLGLFWAIGFRFSPLLVEAWTPGAPSGRFWEKDSPPAGRVQPWIFLALLAFSAGIYLWVYLIRRINGASGGFWETLSFWTCLDSSHFLDIARDGYLSQGEWGRVVQLVFLPGYPLAIRLGALLTGDYLLGAILVSWLSFAGAGSLLYRLVRLDSSHSTALWSVVFLCLAPGSFFFPAPMSESLFLLLCTGCLYLARTRRWLAACILGGLAAFTRTLAVTLVVPLLFELIQEQAHPPLHGRPRKRGKLAADLASLLLVPMGFLAYCGINFQVAGDPFQFMEYQRINWNNETGWFFDTAAYHIDLVLNSLQASSHDALGLWIPNFLACLLSLAVILRGLRQLRPSYTAWFMVYFFLCAGVTWLISAPRYMVGFFPLSLVPASSGPRAKGVWAVLSLLTGIPYLVAFALRWQVW